MENQARRLSALHLLRSYQTFGLVQVYIYISHKENIYECRIKLVHSQTQDNKLHRR